MPSIKPITLEEALDQRVGEIAEYIAGVRFEGDIPSYIPEGTKEHAIWNLGYMAALGDMRALIGFDGGSSAFN